MSDDRPLLLATEADCTLRLAKALDADLSPLPRLDAEHTFEAWRDDILSGPTRSRVIACVWLSVAGPEELTRLDADQWRVRFERPYLLWNFVLGAAGRICRDDGAIVAVAQAPAALDAPGFTPELAISDGVLALVRSVAAAEGPRRVRANLVTTPIGLITGDLVAPAPPLDLFPGTIESHVAGAVRNFLSPDSIGLTGRALAADGGRSL